MLQLRLKRREVCDAPFAFPDELSDPYDLSRLWVFRFSPKK